MPRLTNQDFLKRHYFLAELWRSELLRSMFSILDPMPQLHLHQYYQTINTGTEKDILETRTTVNKGDTALPQQAGRAYSELIRTFLQTAEYLGVPVDEKDLAAAIPGIEKMRLAMLTPDPTRPKARASMKSGTHRVQALMKPEIDVQELAKVLILLAKPQLEQQRAKERELESTDHSSH